MRTRMVCLGVVGMLAGLTLSEVGAVPLPGDSSPPELLQGAVPGQPPGLRYSGYSSFADNLQVDWLRTTGGTTALFASSWYPENYQTVWLNSTTTVAYLKSPTGPGGLRVFPVGMYRARCRGYNSEGYGNWATSSPVQVAMPGTLRTRILSGPRRVGTHDDLKYVWSNNFAASQHRVQVKRGDRTVRSTNWSGSFVANYWASTSPPSWSDRPSSPSRELVNGTAYTFRVSSWSPVAQRWTTWTQRPFQVARGTAAVPRLRYSQQDYNGYFPRSPRPYFKALYRGTNPPAKWTLMDIRKKSGSRLTTVKRQWVSRYDPSCNSGGNSGGVVAGEVWVGGAYAYPDLAPGTYVYRAQSWNGPGRNQSRWTSWGTATVARAGTVRKPSTNGFHFYNGSSGASINWPASPNCYSYNLAIYRNGSLYRTLNNRDPRRTHSTQIWGNTATGLPAMVNYQGARMTTGVYTFRAQATRFYGMTTEVGSAWTQMPGSYTVP